MTYEVIILGHLHMPLYFIGTFTEYSSLGSYIHVYTYKLTFRVNYVYKHLFYFNSPPQLINSVTHQLSNSSTQ